MNKEQAINKLEALVNDLRTAERMINADYLVETLAPILDALKPTVDENGLAKCGCGGAAQEYYSAHPYIDRGYYVECKYCGIVIKKDTAEMAKETWNEGMGAI